MPYYVTYTNDLLYERALADADGVPSAIDPADEYQTVGFATLTAARRFLHRQTRGTIERVTHVEPREIGGAGSGIIAYEWDEERIEEFN